MGTMTCHRKDPPLSTQLNLHIERTRYNVEPIASSVGIRSWRLGNTDNGQTYDVTATHGGTTCTCPDHRYRHEGNGTTCKHVRALRDSGLLDVLRRSSASRPHDHGISPTLGRNVPVARPRSRWGVVRGRLGWYVVREGREGREGSFSRVGGPYKTRSEARIVKQSLVACERSASC
ncbi:hypothetical protein ElP_72410 (plasmid) [Tautonia plasticadhaerens]|uniref:SWIM-type domain-containing protein n=1 Tax=Tautonia plasticadhaerens TaxID=2527974 RepID=A0A518HEK7_9BACT|nr:hypothetical protein ElP_72410 [Tautonia plasticadhaerens]